MPEILGDPAPQAMFLGFGESWLDFRLLAWVKTIDLGLQAQNALRIAVLRKLEGAGILNPLRKGEVHLEAEPDDVRPADAGRK